MRDLHREIGRDALGAGARVAPRILPFAPVDRTSGARERCDTIISLWGLIQNGSGVAAQANAQVGSILAGSSRDATSGVRRSAGGGAQAGT